MRQHEHCPLNHGCYAVAVSAGLRLLAVDVEQVKMI
jgi:hypothetical protein